MLKIFTEGIDNPKIGICRGVFKLYAERFTIIKSPGYNVSAIEEVGIRKASKMNTLKKIARKISQRIMRIFFLICIIIFFYKKNLSI